MTNFVQVSESSWVNADEVTDVGVFEQERRNIYRDPLPSVWMVCFYRGNKRLRVVEVASEGEGKALAQRFAREAALGANREPPSR